MTIRTASLDDLDGIMDAEKDWPEGQRAGRDKFVARLEKFGEGLFVAEMDGRIVATSSSCLMHYDPAHPEKCKSWDAVTNNGYIWRRDEIENPNALYIAAIGIKKEYRAHGLFQKFALAQVALAEKLRLPYVVAGPVLPRYDAYCKEHGEIPAEEYAFKKAGQRLVDPLLEIWRGINFFVPDGKHVIQNYYEDAKSRHYSALVVYETGKSESRR